MKNLTETDRKDIAGDIANAAKIVCSTDAGIYLMQYLHALCGYADHSTIYDNERKVDTISTLQKDAIRGVYVELRKFLTREHLIRIELPELAEPETDAEQKADSKTQRQVRNGRKPR